MTHEGPQGADWGVWDKDGNLKPGMQDVFWPGAVGGIAEPVGEAEAHPESNSGSEASCWFLFGIAAAAAGVIEELARLVKEYPGDSPVYVALETSMGARTLALGPGYRVQPDSDFIAEAKALLGEASVA